MRELSLIWKECNIPSDDDGDVDDEDDDDDNDYDLIAY